MVRYYSKISKKLQHAFFAHCSVTFELFAEELQIIR